MVFSESIINALFAFLGVFVSQLFTYLKEAASGRQKQIDELKQEVMQLRREVEEWKAKYFELLEKVIDHVDSNKGEGRDVDGEHRGEKSSG